MKPTYTEQCFRIFDFLDFDTINITDKVLEMEKKIGCSEPLVWAALRQWKVKNIEAKEEYSEMEKMMMDMLYMRWLMIKSFRAIKELKGVEKRRLNKIDKNIMLYRQEFDLDERGKPNPID